MDNNEQTFRGEDSADFGGLGGSEAGTTDMVDALKALDDSPVGLIEDPGQTISNTHNHPASPEATQRHTPTINRGDAISKPYLGPIDVQGMTLRLATSDDLPGIAAIYNAAISTGSSTADVQPISVSMAGKAFRHSDAVQRPVIVAEKNDQVLGYLTVSDFSGRPAYQTAAEISYFVHPEHLDEGIGRLLIQEAIRRATYTHIRSIVAFIFEDNTSSLALAKDLGFEKWGRIPEVMEIDGQWKAVFLVGRPVA